MINQTLKIVFKEYFINRFRASVSTQNSFIDGDIKKAVYLTPASN